MSAAITYPLHVACPTCKAQVGEHCGPEDYYVFMPHRARWGP